MPTRPKDQQSPYAVVICPLFLDRSWPLLGYMLRAIRLHMIPKGRRKRNYRDP